MISLNEQQRQAVLAPGSCVVIACPGSGKTRVLVERAVRLRKEEPTAEIILVTFTRQAAAEMRHRLVESLGDLSHIRVATFHSLALQQLVAATQTRICGPAEQMALLRLAAQAHLPDSEFRAFQSAADAYTSGQSDSLAKEEYQLAYDAYLQLLGDHSAVDFGHGVLRAVEGMENGTLRPFPCHHLLVDEVQDIDPTQVRWVIAHTSAGAQLTIVGDDDQSIYAFRHALGYRGMRALEAHHRSSRVELVVNYRSHREILGLAVRLINHNQERVPKDLLAAKGPGGSVSLHSRYWTDVDEDFAVARHVAAAKDPWAIIARTNRKLDRVAHSLRMLRVPFSRPGRTQFWELEEPSLFLRLLKHEPLRDPLTRAAVAARAGTADHRSPEATRIFTKYEAAVRAISDSQEPDARIDVVATFLNDEIGGLPKPRIVPSRRLIQQCKEYLSSMDGSLGDRIAQAEKPRSSKQERVQLLTMHGAKGLEFDNVWIVGCQHGTVPSSRADNIEEERRLMYVAMTRAERTLHLSFAWNQVIHRKDDSYLRRLSPSQFITDDLGLPVTPRNQVKEAAA